MEKLLEIDGRLIHISSKTIEINGSPVITQGEITILNNQNQSWESSPSDSTQQSSKDHLMHFA
jgi:hypothetical protein